MKPKRSLLNLHFRKFRHALSPDQKAAKQTNFYIFKKANCYLKALLDQAYC